MRATTNESVVAMACEKQIIERINQVVAVSLRGS